MNSSTTTSFNEKHGTGIRIWHWVFFILLTGSMTTVLLASTLFSTRNNTKMVQELTTYDDDSETSLINRNAGLAPVPVSNETYDLIERSIRISRITQGAFDITYGSVDRRLWNFDTTMQRLPDKETARQLVRLINYRNIIFDPVNTTVLLKEKGMGIGFGGIGKGYAAERAKR